MPPDPPVPPHKLRAEISIREVPSVMFEMRVAMADILRQFAKAEEHSETAARLLEIADWFETGQTWEEEPF